METLYVSEYLQGGVWAAVLVHAAWNGSDALVPAHGDATAWWQTGAACAIAIVLAVLWRRSDRLHAAPDQRVG